MELIIESNQELPSWLEAMSLDSRSSYNNKRAGGGKGRFGGSGFGAKDVRYENGGGGGGGGGKRNDRGNDRGYGGGGGGWSGPPGLKPNFGGNYGGSTGGGPDWWGN